MRTRSLVYSILPCILTISMVLGFVSPAVAIYADPIVLAKPENVCWADGSTATATWDPVENANYYEVSVNAYSSDTLIGSKDTGTTDCSIDVQDIIRAIDGVTDYQSVNVTFKVCAVYKEDGAEDITSDWSAETDAIVYSLSAMNKFVAPTGVIFKEEDYTVSWNVVEGATHYDVWYYIYDSETGDVWFANTQVQYFEGEGWVYGMNSETATVSDGVMTINAIYDLNYFAVAQDRVGEELSLYAVVKVVSDDATTYADSDWSEKTEAVTYCCDLTKYPTPTDVVFNEEDYTVSWNAVEGATRYDICFYIDDPELGGLSFASTSVSWSDAWTDGEGWKSGMNYEPVTVSNGVMTAKVLYDLNYYSAINNRINEELQLYCVVRAVSDDPTAYADSDWSEQSATVAYCCELEKYNPPTEVNFNEDDYSVSWSVVDDATHYNVDYYIVDSETGDVWFANTQVQAFEGEGWVYGMNSETATVSDGVMTINAIYDLNYFAVAQDRVGEELSLYAVVKVVSDDASAFADSEYSEPSNPVSYKYQLATNVESITLSPVNPFVSIGGAYSLGKTIEPADAYYESIDWTSSDDSVVTVDSLGKITGVAAGTATVTAAIGDVSGNANVTVYSLETNLGEDSQEEVLNTANAVINNIIEGNAAGTDIADTNEAAALITTGMENNYEFHVDMEQEQSELSNTEQAEIDALFVNNPIVADVVNVSIELSYDDGQGMPTLIGNITEFDNEIRFELDIPDDLPEVEDGYTREYSVVRIHDGEYEVLDCVENAVDTITVESDKFSDFVILYKDKSDTCVVTFFIDDGFIAQSVAYGEKAEIPSDPTNEMFVEYYTWYADENYSELFNFDTTITEDTTVYGKMFGEGTSDVCIVRFDNFGFGVIPDQVIATGNTATEPEVSSDLYHHFMGWYTDRTYSQKFDFDTVITNNTILYAKWIMGGPSTISFDNNGLGIKPEDQEVPIGDNVVNPGALSADGWTFEGWFADEECSVAFDFDTPIMSSGWVGVYAKWTPIDYSITYNLDGGTVYPSNPEEYTVESTDITLNNPTKDNYEFIGWTGTNLTDPTLVVVIPTGSTGNRSYIANWKGLPQTVTFQTNGGSAIDNQEVEYYETAIEPEDPTQIGYIFDGWYADEDLTVEFDFSMRITSDTVIYAKWVAVETYTVSFNSNGHGADPDPYTVNNGNTATEPAAPSATGWTFGGWYTDEACTTAFDFNTAITEDTILYAKWTPVTYTVTFNANGHGSAPSSQSVTYGNLVAKPSDLTATGYTFGGWYTDSACTKSYNFNTAVTENLALYAKWTANTYTVTFNANGHGSAPVSQSVAYGIKVTKPSDPMAAGYTFGGWYTSAACTTAYNFNSGVTANTTLYAKWTVASTPTPTPTPVVTPTPTPTAVPTPTPTPEPVPSSELLVGGGAHVQDIGDTDVSVDPDTGILTIGTTGMGKRLEEILIDFENTTPYEGTMMYRVHVQDYGWLDWVEAGQKCGTEGESKRIEAIEIKLTGELAKYYSVEYCVHIQDYGDMQGWVHDGALAGTTGESKRIEEIKVRIVPIGADNTMSVKYRVHVQDYGWEKSYASNGAMSGTSGESKRLEGIEIFLDGTQYSGGVKFKTHVQDYGWQGWSYNGEMSGTQGESKRLEGICIELYGEVAEYYDIYYRVHAQDIGWMGWAKNGECAGTAGRSARLEGIQIVLVPKGSPAPDATYEGITAVTDKAFVEGF